MPTLPDPKSLGRRQVVDESRPLQRVVVDDGIGAIAQGMSDVANELGAAADRQVEFQAQNARARWITEKAKLDRQYQEDPGDYLDLNDRYAQDLDRLADDVAGGIGSDRATESFRNTVIVPDREASLTRMQDFAFGLERDDGRARMTESAAALRDVFISGSEEEAAAAAEAYQGLLDAGLEARYMDEEEAASTRLETQRSWAIGRLEAAPAEQRLEMLDGFYRHSIVQFCDACTLFLSQ